jgi:hypothetical protein
MLWKWNEHLRGGEAGARDKIYAVVEGVTHLFQLYRSEYGDTKRRVFDFIDEQASKAERF